MAKDFKHTGRVPTTPYTGGEENSCIGLFIAPERGGHPAKAIIAVAITDPEESAQMGTILKDIENNRESGIGLGWELGINSDASKVEKATAIYAVSFEVAVRRVVDNDDPGEVLFSSEALIPPTVMKNWLEALIDGKMDELELLVLDATKVPPNSPENVPIPFTPGKAEMSWDMTEEDLARLGEDLEALRSKPIDDITYGSLEYPDSALYLKDARDFPDFDWKNGQ